jgi:hypothetical protein
LEFWHTLFPFSKNREWRPKELEMRKTGVVLTPICAFRRYNEIIMAPDNRQSKVKQSKTKQSKAKQRKGNPKQNQRKKRSSATTSFKSKTRVPKKSSCNLFALHT